ncbi:MAG TPA: GTPase HflX [Candidatus Cloacimonadota bacterium]|nr:GTPase HflX [Candidatus Cloacimonadota bacterium]
MLQDTSIQENKRALLVSICLSNKEIEKTIISLNELKRLADTAGYETVDKVYQNRKNHDRAYFLGKGYIESLRDRMKSEEIEYLIFDDELSPSQHANIEKDFNIRVLDRTEIILKIFYLHAKTGEARLQIRLAELKYELPRLKQNQITFDRIAGSSAGGVGFASRGSGEKQIDLDRTKIRAEIHQISEKLNKILIQKKTQSKQREKIHRICLVGYTNAGKSTLFNNLTQSDVLVEDKLFATLDSTVRPFTRSIHDDFVIADTVGFIAKLPHTLVASFRATLKEAKEANLLLHVVDVSDPNFESQISEVNTVLKDIETDHIPEFLVFNKIDCLTPDQVLTLSHRFQNAIFISAKKDLNVDLLIKKIEDFFILKIDYHLLIPYREQKLIAQLHKTAVIKEMEHLENGIRMLVTLDSNYKSQIENYIINQESTVIE